MFRVVTRNSVYSVRAFAGGFLVKKLSSTWNAKPLKRSYAHFTTYISVEVGRPFRTNVLVTTPIVAVIANE